MSTTCLPSTMPSVSNVGPGRFFFNVTVTTDIYTPKATIGTRATNSVRVRLFTLGIVNGPGEKRFAHSVTVAGAPPQAGGYRWGHG
jgi:hypothetical protein